MSILIDQTKRVLVQGITGREGMVRARLMKEYGTNVVAGVTPGKGGQEVLDVPVFDTVEEAWEEVGPFDISVLFIPAPLVKGAALEAIDAGVKLLVIVPDRVPIYDVLTISKRAKEKGAKFVGPNTLGVLSPDKGVLGMMGGERCRPASGFSRGRWASLRAVGASPPRWPTTWPGRASERRRWCTSAGMRWWVYPILRWSDCSSRIPTPRRWSCSAKSAPRRKSR